MCETSDMLHSTIGSFSGDESFLVDCLDDYNNHGQADPVLLTPLPINITTLWNKTDADFLMQTLFRPAKKSPVAGFFSPVVATPPADWFPSVIRHYYHASSPNPSVDVVAKLFSPLASPSTNSFANLAPRGLCFDESLEHSFLDSPVFPSITLLPLQSKDATPTVNDFHLGVYPSPMPSPPPDAVATSNNVVESPSSIPRMESPCSLRTKKKENRKRKAPCRSAEDRRPSTSRKENVPKLRRRGSKTKQKDAANESPLLESTNEILCCR